MDRPDARSVVPLLLVPRSAHSLEDGPMVVTGTPGETLVARGLTKVYRGGDLEVHALRGVDFSLYERELVLLLGASGSGKSTLLNSGRVRRQAKARQMITARDARRGGVFANRRCAGRRCW